jgi:hypothetical protein
MKWQKANDYNFDIYQKIIDVTFDFRRARNLAAALTLVKGAVEPVVYERASDYALMLPLSSRRLG